MHCRARITHIPTCRRAILPRRCVSIRAGVVEQSEIIGRGMVLFVLFSSSLNWMYYRNIRRALEKEKEKDQKKDTKM